MVTTYLRLVVSARFAFREAALAQPVYQVGLAAAHFLKGYTGLTVAVLVHPDPVLAHDADRPSELGHRAREEARQLVLRRLNAVERR